MSEQSYTGLTPLFLGENVGNAVLFSSCGEDTKYRMQFLQEIQKVGAQISYWYLENPTVLLDEEAKGAFLDDVKVMKLVVIPITSAFFEAEDNYARDIVIPFCVKEHIPLLPIMMEPGLAEAFNYACGNIQFLEYSQYDKTAVSFEVKLSNFIHDVLLAEEYVTQIRDMFAAYIFLSYRKKDRKEAQEIMRQIHAFEGCEDLAIWYDEFLTPGEDFNVSIMEAMKKSKLFALVVTPNLLEEKNYVARIEYPEAVKMDKTVLPILARPTDYAKLYEMFSLTPECIKEARNISDDLYVLTGDKTEETSTRKQFLLGLAYLNGIDVEVDYERAVKLLTDAGNSGYEPAAKQLIFMFDNGFGVAQDDEAALKWALKYNEILEAMPLIDAKTAKKRVRSLKDLAERFLSKSDSKKSLEYYDRMLSMVDDVAVQDFMGDSLFELRTLVYTVWAELTDAGYEPFADCLSERKKLEWHFSKTSGIFYSSKYNSKAQGESSYEQSYMEMYRCFVCGDIEGMKEVKSELLSLLNKTNSDRFRRDIFLTNCYMLKLMRKAKVPFSEMFEIYDEQERLSESFINATLEDKLQLAESLRRRGDILFSSGCLTEAKGFYQKSLALLEEILSGRKIAGALKEMYFVYQGLYDATDEKQEAEKKKFFAEKCYEISNTLIAFAKSFYSLAMKADACAEMLNMAKLADDRETAEKYHEEYLSVCKEIENSKLYAHAQSLFKMYGSIASEEGLRKGYRAGYRVLQLLGVVLIVFAVMQLLKVHIVRFILLLLPGICFILAGSNKYANKAIEDGEKKTMEDSMDAAAKTRIVPRMQ